MNSTPNPARRRINPWKLFVGAFIPNWLLSRREISAGAKLCYARLAQYSGVNAVAYPKQSTLSGELGVDERTARRYLSELEEFSLIETEQRGLTESNEYFFLDHPWMHEAKPPPREPASERSLLPALPGAKSPVLDRTDLSGQERANLSGPVKRRESIEENQTPLIPLEGECLSGQGKSNFSLEAQAEQIYEAYPKKVGRPAALRKIAIAIRKHGFPLVLERTRRYASTYDGSADFIPHPSTWFTQERFLDPPETWRRNGDRPQHRGQERKALRESELNSLRAALQTEHDSRRRLELEEQIEQLETLEKR